MQIYSKHFLKVSIITVKVVEQKSNYEKSLKVFENYKKNNHEIFKPSLISNTSDKSIYANLEIMRTYNYPIFFLDDIIAYCSILQFYTNKYKSALESLYSLEKMLLIHKKNYINMSEENDSTLSLSTYGLKFSIMALNECYYNILLCNLLIKDFKTALKFANELLMTLKPQAAFWIVLIRFMIQEALGQSQKSNVLADSRCERYGIFKEGESRRNRS